MTCRVFFHDHPPESTHSDRLYCIERNLRAVAPGPAMAMAGPYFSAAGLCLIHAKPVFSQIEITGHGVRMVYVHVARTSNLRVIWHFLHCLYIVLHSHALAAHPIFDSLRRTNTYKIERACTPHREVIFKTLKKDLSPDTPGFRTLCPTRWTVRAASLQSVLDNFDALCGVWEEVLDAVCDSEVRARVIGVNTIMHSFDFLFGVVLGERVLRHTDNLSKTLQNPSLSATDARACAKLTVSTLRGLRTNNSFKLFWANVLDHQTWLEVSEPKLPRKRKAPARIAEGSEPHHHTTPESKYWQEFFAVIDLVTNCIEQRFNQPGYRSISMLENLLIWAAGGTLPKDDEVADVVAHCGSDATKSSLVTQLEILASALHGTESQASQKSRTTFCSLSDPQRTNLSEVCTLLKIIMVSPATNAVSEQSASALRRVKAYLRSTMSQDRLNHLQLLHTHKTRMDALVLEACLQDFVDTREHRKEVFGSFSKWVLAKLSFVSLFPYCKSVLILAGFHLCILSSLLISNC